MGGGWKEDGRSVEEGGREEGGWEEVGRWEEEGREIGGWEELGDGWEDVESEASSNDDLKFLFADRSPPPCMATGDRSPPPCRCVQKLLLIVTSNTQ